MWFASQFCQAVCSHTEAHCPLQWYEEEAHPPCFFADSEFSFSKPYVQLCFHTLIPCWALVWPYLFIIYLALLPFFYLYSVVRYTPCVWARYTYSEAQPALGLGAVFPHPSDTVADSVCPTEKVMLLSRSECHSSVAVTLLELSRFWSCHTLVCWLTGPGWCGQSQGRPPGCDAQ